MRTLSSTCELSLVLMPRRHGADHWSILFSVLPVIHWYLPIRFWHCYANQSPDMDFITLQQIIAQVSSADSSLPFVPTVSWLYREDSVSLNLPTSHNPLELFFSFLSSGKMVPIFTLYQDCCALGILCQFVIFTFNLSEGMGLLCCCFSLSSQFLEIWNVCTQVIFAM